MSAESELFQRLAQSAPGRISIAVHIENGKVVVLLSQKTDRLEIEPDGAAIFAATLMKFAERAGAK